MAKDESLDEAEVSRTRLDSAGAVEGEPNYCAFQPEKPLEVVSLAAISEATTCFTEFDTNSVFREQRASRAWYCMHPMSCYGPTDAEFGPRRRRDWRHSTLVKV
jgi:hypothetical protein